jgi:hypothetical protein
MVNPLLKVRGDFVFGIGVFSSNLKGFCEMV